MTIVENLEGYEPQRAKQTLQMLLIDRKSEFKDLASGIGIPSSSPNWEQTILKFCLDFNLCFKEVMISMDGPNDANEKSHNRIHQCLTLFRQMARGKTSMNEVTHLQNLAYTIAEEFKTIYKRLG